MEEINNKMLRENSPRAYYVRNFLLNIIGNDRESKKQRLETVFFVAFEDRLKFQL